MFAEDDIHRRRAEREAADRIYNDALTALDRAVPRLPDYPHPPVPYDEHQVTPINERWQVVGTSPEGGFTGWRRRLAAFVWKIVEPALARQESFNSALVDHLNRNVPVHRATQEAMAATLATLRAELEKLEAFHTTLILYIQTITLYVDTKDRSEHSATLVNFFHTGLALLSDEITRRSETMHGEYESVLRRLDDVARDFTRDVTDLAGSLTAEHERRREGLLVRDRQQAAVVDELRTNLASVQQTGATLKRELERLLQAMRSGAAAAGAVPPATGASESRRVGAGAAGPGPAASAPAQPVATGQAAAFTDALNAHKYVGFENKFRGSEEDIRARQLEYVRIFAGASDVLDLGCGRGEFLVLLREHSISGRGLDINHEMVEVCRERGLTVDEGDAIAFLEGLPDASLGGLVALQVAEHFPPPYLLRFLDLAYLKLRPGAPIVLETLNPACWFAFFEAYIRDVTHAWPLHPETLKYLVVVSGFQHAEIQFSSPYPAGARLQHCTPPGGDGDLAVRSMVQTLNENVDKVNALMFGYLDYAVVARRG